MGKIIQCLNKPQLACCFNIKCHITSSWDFRYKDKIVSQPSYLHNGYPYGWKNGLNIEIGSILPELHCNTCVTQDHGWLVLTQSYLLVVCGKLALDGPWGKIYSIWVRSRNCGCLVTWFCYQLIAKPVNKTATVSWPDPYAVLLWSTVMDTAMNEWYFLSVCGTE